MPTVSVDSSSSESTHLPMDTDVSDGTGPLELISQGIDVRIIVGTKAMFQNIMLGLDDSAPPVFTCIQCGDAGVKVSIKLDVQNLPSASGQRVLYSVVEGETKMDRPAAEASAIEKALKVLKEDHLIRIVDFISLLAQRVEANDTHELLLEAVGALEKVLVHWDITVGNSKRFCAKLEDKESNENIYAPRTPRGWVYGSLSDYLTDVHNTFYHRTNLLRSKLIETKAELESYQKMLEKGQTLLRTGQSRDVSLSPKFILEYVICVFGLDEPQYVNSTERHGFVKSEVMLDFPRMGNLKYHGKISVRGQSYTSAQADEEAAYQALLFIEEHFKTKVVDYNYRDRKKVIKEQSILITHLSKVLQQADVLKMMFGELMTAIVAQRRHFSFDPSLFFAGRLGAGQIDAYNFCSAGLAEIEQSSAKNYAACASHFDVLNKLTWKLLVLKTNPPIYVA